jgi:hypothetical protein
MGFVVMINVIDILNGQKFSFPMNSDSGYRVKHLTYEMNMLVKRTGDPRLLFIKNGRVMDEEEYIMMPNTHRSKLTISVDFFLLAQPKAKVVSDELPLCVLDDQSLSAAKEWMVRTV